MEFQKWSVSSLNSFWFMSVVTNLMQGCVHMIGRNIFKSGRKKAGIDKPVVIKLFYLSNFSLDKIHRLYFFLTKIKAFYHGVINFSL